MLLIKQLKEDDIMKKVTLAEFAEMMKSDKALQQKMIEAANNIGGGSYRDALKALASEYGYELELTLPADLESLPDDDLEHVAGGWDIFSLCKAVMEFLGMDGYCY